VHLRVVDERGRELLVRRQYHARGGANAQRGPAVGDRVQRVLDRQQFARARERRQTERVRRIAHDLMAAVVVVVVAKELLLFFGSDENAATEM
jgi:hypothetical protein